MDISAHFESLTRELEALRDRVRNFSIMDPHWPTDGEWKESVLRSVLRSYLPAHVEPLRGFAVTQDRGSHQIDVLLYDNRKPVLFRNGDLIFVTPDAILGVVEVKSNIGDRSDLRAALQSLADNAQMIRSYKASREGLFAGLFSYTTDMGPLRHESVREELDACANGARGRVITHVSLGCSHFAMFWDTEPGGQDLDRYDSWHSYDLPDQAAGYFINNLIAAVSSESVESNSGVWFPAQSKELRRLGQTQFVDNDCG